MTREDFLIELMQYHGTPYIYGGQSIKGTDCSGLVIMAFKKFGIIPGDASATQLFTLFLKMGTPVIFDKKDLGDLAFFGQNHRITHVGIVLNNELMLEAAGGDSTVTTEAIAKEKGAIVKINALHRRNDLISVVRPKALPWFKEPISIS